MRITLIKPYKKTGAMITPVFISEKSDGYLSKTNFFEARNPEAVSTFKI